MVVHLGHHWLYKLEYNIHNPFNGFFMFCTRPAIAVYGKGIDRSMIFLKKSTAASRSSFGKILGERTTKSLLKLVWCPVIVKFY